MLVDSDVFHSLQDRRFQLGNNPTAASLALLAGQDIPLNKNKPFCNGVQCTSHACSVQAVIVFEIAGRQGIFERAEVTRT